MSAEEIRFRISTVKYATADFRLHPWARTAHDIFLKSGSIAHRYPGHKLLSQHALSDALRLSPLPVIRMDNSGRRATFGVIGRFNIFHQLTEIAPNRVTLAIIAPEYDKRGIVSRFMAATQGMIILDAGGRCAPIQEFEAVWSEARRHQRGLTSLIDGKPSIRKVSKRLGCKPDKLRRRHRRRKRSSSEPTKG